MHFKAFVILLRICDLSDYKFVKMQQKTKPNCRQFWTKREKYVCVRVPTYMYIYVNIKPLICTNLCGYLMTKRRCLQWRPNAAAAPVPPQIFADNARQNTHTHTHAKKLAGNAHASLLWVNMLSRGVRV